MTYREEATMDLSDEWVEAAARALMGESGYEPESEEWALAFFRTEAERAVEAVAPLIAAQELRDAMAAIQAQWQGPACEDICLLLRKRADALDPTPDARLVNGEEGPQEGADGAKEPRTGHAGPSVPTTGEGGQG